jgi:hypothetical protein
MKLIKLTMLAAVAAVAAMAFIGASTASAVTHPWLAVCLKAELLLCKTANLAKHPLLGRVIALVGPGLFKAGFEIKCNKGEGKSTEIESQQTGGFKGTLEALNFSECTGGCTKVKVITPQAVEVSMESEGTETWRLKSANAKVEFFECLFGVKCKFEGTINRPVEMDAEGVYVDPGGTEFKRIEGPEFCGATGKWESGRTRLDWLLDDLKNSIHKNVWMSLLEKLTVAAGTEL